MIRARGFSLVELAVALAIIALLLAGALIPLSTQIDVRNSADTRRSMESIREAIIGFAQANGRLPCPADGSIAAGGANAGTERFDTATGACTLVFGAPVRWGVIPWATLGTAETDAWGRRFSYGVATAFSDLNANGTWATTTPGAQSPGCTPTPAPTPPTSFALCSLGSMAVFTRGGTSTAAVASGAGLPAVFISHGKNGFGAWQTNGTQVTPIPVGNDEASNLGNASADPPAVGYTSWAFYSRTPTPAATGCVDPAPNSAPSTAPLCEFDDIVVMISSNALIARMVAAGRLP